MTELTRTQHAALTDLTERRRLWPCGRGRFAAVHEGPAYSERTLDALVTAGHARWEHRPGVMPHIVAATEPHPAAPSRPTLRALIEQWRGEADRLDGNHDENVYDPEGEADERVAAALRSCADDLERYASTTGTR